MITRSHLEWGGPVVGRRGLSRGATAVTAAGSGWSDGGNCELGRAKEKGHHEDGKRLYMW